MRPLLTLLLLLMTCEYCNAQTSWAIAAQKDGRWQVGTTAYDDESPGLLKVNNGQWRSYFAYKIRFPAFSVLSKFRPTLQESQNGDADVTFTVLEPFSSEPTVSSVRSAFNAGNIVGAHTEPASKFDGVAGVSFHMPDVVQDLIDHEDWADNYVDGDGGWVVVVITSPGSIYKFAGKDHGSRNEPIASVIGKLATDVGHRWNLEEHSSNDRVDSAGGVVAPQLDLFPVLPPIGREIDEFLGYGVKFEFGDPDYLRAKIDSFACTNTDFTALFWVNADTNGPGTVAARGRNTPGYRGWSINQREGEWQAEVNGDDDPGFPFTPEGSQSRATSTFSVPTTAGRHMVGIAYFAAERSVGLIIDHEKGQPVQLPNNSSIWCPDQARFVIGSYDSGGSPHFTGSVAWGAFWYRKLLNDELDYFWFSEIGEERMSDTARVYWIIDIPGIGINCYRTRKAADKAADSMSSDCEVIEVAEVRDE